ncbi:tRNA pseudouridine(55) synthase TruB [Alkaliflexus imshenetskii]|uniref:tRNA pseudouridine(55) synthase TruB n=1 Tax=Alkaliflexus imshenetskii TaxID=286730 RepID=UPI0004AFD8B5|nr:tRNA pseudouridine(55) synthase TruB [Alkaliflexus imshenetskii]
MEELVNSLRVHDTCRPDDFKDGRILLINKPYKWSSFDVVNKVRIMLRNHLGFKKIKVGHAGTLDPLATGLLILCTGSATKQIEALMGMPKEYVAGITFGATTPSYDLETDVNALFDASAIHVNNLQHALTGFMGKQMQRPPVFSAIKMNGRRAYEHARKGKDVEMAAREVEFMELELLSFDNPVANVRIVCSKGTYIRSFAHDLGLALGNGAHLSALERTAIGPVRLSQAYDVSDFEEILKKIQTN